MAERGLQLSSLHRITPRCCCKCAWRLLLTWSCCPAALPPCPALPHFQCAARPTHGVHLSIRRLPVGTIGCVASVALVTARAMPEANAMAPGAAILEHRRAGTPYAAQLCALLLCSA